jgi:putative ABC transport system permease protein
MRRSPLLYLVAAVSLSLGVAANTTIFTGVDALLYRPLPYPESARLVQVWTTHGERGWTEMGSSLADVDDWAAALPAELAVYRGVGVNVQGSAEPERLSALRTSARLFGVLGVGPQLGRAPRADEEQAGAARVVVISHGMWQRRFGGAGSVLGEVLSVDGEPHEVIGVMPAGFEFADSRTDLWLPLGRTGEEARDERQYLVIGRLGPGATIASLEAALARAATQLEAAYPGENHSIGARAVALHRQLFDETFWTAAMICTVAVAFVLLIACANIANLLLARAATREREIAVRSALGATRARIVRQLLTESLVLALIGGALGVLLSIWGVRGLGSLIPEWFPYASRIALNGRALLFTLGVSLFAGVLFGLAPALHATRPSLAGTLRESGGRGAALGARGGRLRSGLVVAQMALTLVLVIAAGLLVKGYAGMRRVPLGFETAGVLTFKLALPERMYPDSVALAGFQEALLERMRALPGVRIAAATTILPMQGGSGTYYTVEGAEPVPEESRPVTQFRAVSADYFTTLGTGIVRGRAIDTGDRLHAEPVALVNEAFVRRHWDDASDALGRRIELSSGGREIVGIVADTRVWGPGNDAPPILYVPLAQRPFRNVSIALRTTVSGSTTADAVRAEIVRLDPEQPIYDLRTLDEIVSIQLKGDAIMPRLLSIFGALALLMAIMGVYGVMAYSVAQRTPEVGVRMALGAARNDILRLIIRQGALLAALGAVLGVAGALAVARFLAAFLFGVSPFDATTFVVATLGLGLAALAASLLPARKAAATDPAVALRYD